MCSSDLKKQSLKIITPETQLNIPSFKEKEASFELYDDDTILSKFFDEKQREYINNASRAYKYIKPFKRGDKDCCATVNNNNYRVYKMLNKGGDRVLCLKIKGKYLPYRHLTHSDSDKLHSNKDASLLDRKEEALIGFLFHRGFID